MVDFTWSSLCASCVHISSYKYTHPIGLGPIHITEFFNLLIISLIYLSYLFEDPIPKYSHILRFWRLGLQHSNWQQGGGRSSTVQPIAEGKGFYPYFTARKWDPGSVFPRSTQSLGLRLEPQALDSQFIFFSQQAWATGFAELSLVRRGPSSGNLDLEFIIGLALKALSFPSLSCLKFGFPKSRPWFIVYMGDKPRNYQ